MSPLERIEEERTRIVAECNAIYAACDKDEREPTAEEQTKLDAGKARLEQLAARAKREQDRMIVNASPIIQTGPWPGEPTKVSNPKPAWLNSPTKGFETPRDFFCAVLEASQAGRTDDERLKYLSGKRSGFWATAGSDEAGTYSDPYGGFLVPSGFYANLLTRGSDADPTVGRVTTIPMGTPKVTIPARTDQDHSSSVSGGLVVYRRAETQSVTAARMTMEQVELSAVPLMGLSYATEELITDSAISFVALLEAGFRSEFGSKILYEKIHGTGAGQYEGVINSPALVTITKETGQAADTIVYQNIVKARARCWGYQNAIWLYNQDALPQLMQLVQTIGTSGVPVWQTSAREDAPDMLLGRPAFPSEYCASIGDVGDIILGNWSQYLEGTYQPLQSAESLHVRFENNERTFRFTQRCDGRCWWRAALTPKKSSVTLSPFVVLAAR